MYVYAIGLEKECVKFGIAKDPQRRLSGIRTGCPMNVRLLAAMEVGSREIARELEKLAHEAMRQHYLRGEWFAWCRDTEQVIARLRAHDSRQVRTWLKQCIQKLTAPRSVSRDEELVTNRWQKSMDCFEQPRRRFQ